MTIKRSFAVLCLLAGMLGGAPVRAAVQPACGAGAPTRSFTGTFDQSLQGAYVMLPFDVAAGTTKVRVRLCYSKTGSPLAGAPEVNVRHTLDLGLYHALGVTQTYANGTWTRSADPADALWDRNEFRGWGGSSRPDVFVSPDDATRGFDPGPIPAGTWAAEIGVAAIAGARELDSSGTVDWRLEVFLTSDVSDAANPWSPATYDATPANPNAGWYKGDFHVHAWNSGNGVTDPVAMGYAFAPPTHDATGRLEGAGLDFVTLSDYVGDRQWGEIGREQAAYPGHLIIRSAEVITYRGHVNNHGSLVWADYRTGPIYLFDDAAKSLTALRGPRPASEIFDDVHSSPSGWTQVNHPWIFPSQVPGFSNICRGCPWDYTDAETDWSKVDAYEVSTGPGGYYDPPNNQPGPNPFTPPAIATWDSIRDRGFRVTAVGSSDSHQGGSYDLTSAPIGQATTVVHASELSEAGIREGVRAGHAYVKFFESDGPDLRFTATPLAGGPSVEMGDELAGPAAIFTATVIGADAKIAMTPQDSRQPRILVVMRDGAPFLIFPVTSPSQTYTFVGAAPGNYRLQLERGSAFEALTNPITLTGTP